MTTPSSDAPKVRATCALALAALFAGVARAEDGAPARADAPAAEAVPAAHPGAIGIAPDPSIRRARVLNIEEFAVEGSTRLSTADVEAAVSPFLGPGRPLADVEGARAALEKAYADRGFQAVSVIIPPQTVRGGVVVLRVTEGTVGRLRVRGSRWFDLEDIKQHAPSVAEGEVPNVDAIMRDIVVLNQLPDRRITPALRPGADPGTIDVDLNVQDTLPLHGSVEWNNRYSGNTTRQRVNLAARYDNLWQLGHSLGLSAQLAPERLQDGEVFSGTYLARFPDAPWLSLSASGTIQQSNISTLGQAAVEGRARIIGGRASFTLPGRQGLFHSATAGVDSKLFLDRLRVGGSGSQQIELRTPLHYWPVTAQYAAAWSGRAAQTQASASIVFNLRGLSSSPEKFDDKRYQALASFFYLRGDFSRTDDLGKFQLAARLSGQYSPDPLIGPEQLTAGGAESVRGYLEGQAAGDGGLTGSVELRSPSLLHRRALSDWRFSVFTDGAWLGVRRTVAEQQADFLLWSVGAGTRLAVFEHGRVAVDVGLPLRTEPEKGEGRSRRFAPRLHLRAAVEF